MGIPDKDREKEAVALMKNKIKAPFDLGKGPLYRVSLLRLNEKHILLLIFHHCVFDGPSVGIFMRDFTTLYEAYREGKRSPLTDLPIQYSDYSVWQRGRLVSGELENQLKYWRQKFHTKPQVLQLPSIKPRPNVRSSIGEGLPIEISAETTSSLTKIGQISKGTLFMVVCSALSALLYRYTGQDDFCIAWPISTRTIPETQDIIGFFVNTLVLRIDVNPTMSFNELLSKVRENCLEVYSNPDVPFELLVKELKID